MYPDGVALAAAEQQRMETRWRAAEPEHVRRFMRERGLEKPRPPMQFSREFLDPDQGLGAFYNPEEGLCIGWCASTTRRRCWRPFTRRRVVETADNADYADRERFAAHTGTCLGSCDEERMQPTPKALLRLLAHGYPRDRSDCVSDGRMPFCRHHGRHRSASSERRQCPSSARPISPPAS